MKKLLKASTAIVGVALIASSAHAGLEISGTGRLLISMGGDAPGADTMQFDAEGYYIGFSGSKKTDSGLTLSGGAYLNDTVINGVDNASASWDKTNLALSGGFGKIEISNKGDASNLSGSATYLDAADYGFDGLSPIINASGLPKRKADIDTVDANNNEFRDDGSPPISPSANSPVFTIGNIARDSKLNFTKTYIEIPRGTTRINYYLPNIAGFSAGFSIMDSGGDGEFNAKTDSASPVIGKDVDTSFNLDATRYGVVADNTPSEFRDPNPIAQALVAARKEAAGYDKSAGVNNNGRETAFAFGLKYAAPFGLTLGYGSTRYSQSKIVKGYTAEVMASSGERLMRPSSENHHDEVQTFVASLVNGEYLERWTGDRVNIGYSIGGLSVGYTISNQEFVTRIAGVELIPTAAEKARDNANNTEIALKYDYGKGSVSYQTKTEEAGFYDSASRATTISAVENTGKVERAEYSKIEDISASIISVNHEITPGVSLYLQSITVEGDFDRSNDPEIEVASPPDEFGFSTITFTTRPIKYDTASELVIGLTVRF